MAAADSTAVQGYDACHNPDEVIERIGYDAEQDTANPTGSVFYEHGSSLVVPWDKVKDYMHGKVCCSPGQMFHL